MISSPQDTVSVALTQPSPRAARPTRILVHDYVGHPFQVQLSRALADNGHEVMHAFAGSLQTPRGELVRRESDPVDFNVTEIPMNSDFAKYKYSFRRRRGMELEYARAAGRLIAEWQPEVVLSSNTPTEVQSALIDATRSLEGQFVYWVQDVYSVAVEKILRRRIPVIGSLVGKYYRHLDRQHFRDSDHIVAITEDFVPLLSREFDVDARRVSVVPNWAPIDALPALGKDNEWARANDLHDKFVFLYTGTLGMKHNPELLVQLAEQFREDDEVRVVVVSEGLGSDWIRNQAATRHLENIVLLPFQPFDQLAEVLATGDVLVSVLEEDAGVFSVPSKVLSYLCAQRALLLAVPEVNLASRIIRQQEAGVAVRPGDVDEFLSAARALRSNASLRATQGDNARAYAEATFRMPEIVRRFESILCHSPFVSSV